MALFLALKRSVRSAEGSSGSRREQTSVRTRRRRAPKRSVATWNDTLLTCSDLETTETWLFTINLKQEPGGAEQALLAHNGSINTIFMCDACEAARVMFTSVLDAIQGDGFNPLWREVQITFNAGHAPRQLFSDNEVADAAAAGEITLAPTDEVYRCSVIGPNK